MIIRRKHNSSYTIVPNIVLNDEALTYDAIGLLCYLLSKPDNWTVQLEQLRHRGGIGRDKARKLINLLIHAGYITRRKVRDPESQAFVSDEYVVFDEPFPDDQKVSNLEVDTKPAPESQSVAIQEPAPEKPAPENPSHSKYCKVVNTEKDNPLSYETGNSDQASPSKPKERVSYSETFERFWKAYPTTPNMPKPNAFKEWQRLDVADRQAAFASLPAMKRDLAKESWRPAVYAERYLKQRRFDGYAQSAGVSELDAMDWPKHCALALKTGQWPRAWGPAPGKPDCRVPTELMTPELTAALQGRRLSA